MQPKRRRKLRRRRRGGRRRGRRRRRGGRRRRRGGPLLGRGVAGSCGGERRSRLDSRRLVGWTARTRPSVSPRREGCEGGDVAGRVVRVGARASSHRAAVNRLVVATLRTPPPLLLSAPPEAPWLVALARRVADQVWLEITRDYPRLPEACRRPGLAGGGGGGGGGRLGRVAERGDGGGCAEGGRAD